MSTAIQNTLGATNYTLAKLWSIRDLIKTYILGVQIYQGIKSVGSEDMVFPCIMLQPVSNKTKMINSAKFDTSYTFDIYWWVGSQNSEDCVLRVTDMGEILQKLFSNNALGDLNGAHTSQFMAYGSNWLDSKMTEIKYGPPLYLGDKPSRPKFAALGCFQITLQTVLIK
jgi:hypothetical protein